MQEFDTNARVTASEPATPADPDLSVEASPIGVGDAAEKTQPSSQPQVFAAPKLPARTKVALFLGRTAATLSKKIRGGDGAIIGGRVAIRLDPAVLRRVSAGRQIVLVTGTNGKTTTSHFLAAALRSRSPVAHNATGANMPDGVLSALCVDQTSPYAVCEVDELHLADVAEAVKPVGIVVLNLSRDQLDRVNEIRRTAGVISAAITANPDAFVVANANDPMVVWAARGAKRSIWVATSPHWQGERSCPQCGSILRHESNTWDCDCGLTRPDPDWSLDEGLLQTPAMEIHPLHVKLPGHANGSNAAMAIAAAEAMGVSVRQSVAAVETLTEITGRYRVVRVGQHTVRMLLAKNPAGWIETLSVISEQPDRPVLIAINARDADGRDTSWLWDVPFERLQRHPVVAAGEAGADLGVRLTYADVDHRTAHDPLEGLATLPAGPVDLVGSYSAFRDLNRIFERAH